MTAGSLPSHLCWAPAGPPQPPSRPASFCTQRSPCAFTWASGFPQTDSTLLTSTPLTARQNQGSHRRCRSVRLSLRLLPPVPGVLEHLSGRTARSQPGLCPVRAHGPTAPHRPASSAVRAGLRPAAFGPSLGSRGSGSAVVQPHGVILPGGRARPRHAGGCRIPAPCCPWELWQRLVCHLGLGTVCIRVRHSARSSFIAASAVV